MELVVPRPGESLFQLARRCDALYICPTVGGIRTGKLVAYAGTDPQGKNLVGDIYFNFRRIEPHLKVVEAFAEAARAKLEEHNLLDSFDTICGIPNGGRTFGQELARILGKRFVYPEKKPKPTEPGKKQEYTWDLSQFDFAKGERLAVGEDVYNNFKNADHTLTEVAATGAEVTLLVGALNRSPLYDKVYIPKTGSLAGCQIPIIASIREAFPEYTQNDPAVAEDIVNGNVEFEVKKHWRHLCATMTP